MDHTGMRRRHRVAIVGGGFGGLFAAKRLGRYLQGCWGSHLGCKLGAREDALDEAL